MSERDQFLCQPLVCAVLKELGESEPETLLEKLLAEVRRRLRAHSSAVSESQTGLPAGERNPQ